MYDYMWKVILRRPWWVPSSPHLKARSPDPSFMFCVLNLTWKMVQLEIAFWSHFTSCSHGLILWPKWGHNGHKSIVFSFVCLLCRFKFSKIRKRPLKCDHYDLTLVTFCLCQFGPLIVTNFWRLSESKPKMCPISPQNGRIWPYKLKHPI